jgi:hypothetical protein
MVSRRLKRIELMGVPQGRTGADLNVGLEPSDDALHAPGGPLPYEWWYFDAAFDNGYSAVAIIWPMNYSRPWRRQCTVQLSIYTPNGRTFKHYAFPPARLFSASTQTCDVRVGDSYMKGAFPRYEISVGAGGDRLDLTFESLTVGWKPGTGENIVPFPLLKSMGWLVAVPLAKVSGTLTVDGRTLEVSGHGYHDHNWGATPIFHVVDNWHWGHVVSGEVAITWADITMNRKLAYQRAFMFLVSRGGRLLYESSRIVPSYGLWRDDPAYLHPYPGKVTVSFGEGCESTRGEFSMTVREVIETQDLLDMVGVPRVLARLVHRLASRPYYFRWLSAVEGSGTVDGEPFELRGDTIHEQMLFRGRRPREMMLGTTDQNP